MSVSFDYARDLGIADLFGMKKLYPQPFVCTIRAVPILSSGKARYQSGHTPHVSSSRIGNERKRNIMQKYRHVENTGEHRQSHRRPKKPGSSIATGEAPAKEFYGVVRANLGLQPVPISIHLTTYGPRMVPCARARRQGVREQDKASRHTRQHDPAQPMC